MGDKDNNIRVRENEKVKAMQVRVVRTMVLVSYMCHCLSGGSCTIDAPHVDSPAVSSSLKSLPSGVGCSASSSHDTPCQARLVHAHTPVV